MSAASGNPGAATDLAILSVFTIERTHMGLALFTASGLLAPVCSAIARLMPHSSAHARHITASETNRNTINSIASFSCPARANPRNHSNTGARRPVRVLRLVDASLPAAGVGRMVISGTMADVCAELDRMVAAEATLH